jgi:hypothetical protein
MEEGEEEGRGRGRKGKRMLGRRQLGSWLLLSEEMRGEAAYGLALFNNHLSNLLFLV